MNVARSTFMRKGYLLTALAVAVLLAGSSGTAWAQTTGVSTTATSRFSGSSGTLPEGADEEMLSKPRPLEVTIRRTTKSSNDPYNTSADRTSDRTPETISSLILNTTATLAFLLGSQLRRTIESDSPSNRRRRFNLSVIGEDEGGKDRLENRRSRG